MELRNKLGLTEKEFLEQYDANKYEKPSVTVDMVIFTVTNEEIENLRKLPNKELQVLMIKRGDHPFLGKWALPGGFVNINESLDTAAKRELKEETNIDNIYMEQLFTFGDVDRDPRTRVISSSYMSLIDSTSVNVEAGDDASDANWFSVKREIVKETKTNRKGGFVQEKCIGLTMESEDIKLSAVVKVTKEVVGKVTSITREIVECEGIAFDHAKAIEYGIERLRSKIEYTDIAFNLMPELFTLTDLQRVYEIILGKELLKANFRRKIESMVVETNEYQKGEEGKRAFRPAKLYRFNPNWKDEIF